MNIKCHIIGFEETVEIDEIKDDKGNRVDLKPIESSRKAFLQLQINDSVIKVNVSNADYDNIVIPLFDELGQALLVETTKEM